MMEFIRFFSVSAGGVLIDLAIAYGLATLLGVPLWIAAAIGFSIAAFGNYVLHEIWTFRSEASRVSAKRSVYYVITSGLTLLSRLAVVAWLSTWISRDHTLLILVCGAAASFFVNYIISKHLIFRRPGENEGHSS